MELTITEGFNFGVRMKKKIFKDERQRKGIKNNMNIQNYNTISKKKQKKTQNEKSNI